MDATVTFVGAGNMASSMVGGLLRQGHAPQKIRVADADIGQRERFLEQWKIEVFANNIDAIESADVVVLAVKPQQILQVCKEINPNIDDSVLVISIAAGIDCITLRKHLHQGSLVRSMPNTPAMIGLGMTGVYAPQLLSNQHRQWVEVLFESVGRMLWLETETQLNMVTALSGSGPAYVYLLAESMMQAGINQGLTEDIAKKLVIQTFVGAAEMMNRYNDPTSLRQAVTSPQGTTEAALQSFDAHGFQQIVQAAADACRDRAQTIATSYRDI